MGPVPQVNDIVRPRVEAALAAGDRFQDYVIDSAIGHGGSAVVYRAHSAEEPTRAVALKVLDAHHLDPNHLHRMEREFDFANRVKHPHVVTMFGHGLGWLAMELITGGSISALTARSNVLAALQQIAEALDHCHRAGVVHCDVKPSNILVAEDFSVDGAILIDFGVARRLTDHVDHHPTHVEASLSYAAPELLRGHAPTPAVDEYALACTAVELLTGTPPFTARTSWGLMDDQLNRAVPRLSRRYRWLPRMFDSILTKAMAKNPELRYNSCGEFVTQLRAALRPTVK
ncbi:MULTISPECIES: serine/threonine-protein kinase [unclassified Mycobacterium]|uniref:serine/threonine-protein kinase n=1 Tax=unclassified Mycobacterium TaxID=2642494 RepID=UPI0029C83B46|nr:MULTISPECIES: serine/threonine-protein kinase [unclassified Mycobacterium]